MTTVINLYGAPGAGKSSGAVYVFSKLKLDGINCEYVPEFAKDKCWEDNRTVFGTPENQFFIGANQFYRMIILKDKVDVIITDSPIYLNAFYGNSKLLGKEYETIMFRLSEMFNNINFFINRTKKYCNSGRSQTEEQSNEMAKEIKNFIKNRISFIEVNGNKNGYETIYDTIINSLKK